MVAWCDDATSAVAHLAATILKNRAVRKSLLTANRWQIDPCIVLKWSRKSGTYSEFVCAVTAIFLLPVWPKTAVGGLFSPAMCVLRSVVGCRLAEVNFGSNNVVDGLSEWDKIWQLYTQGVVMHNHPHW